MNLPSWAANQTISASNLNLISSCIAELAEYTSGNSNSINVLSSEKLSINEISSYVGPFLEDNITNVVFNSGEFGALEQKILPSASSIADNLNTLMDQIKDLRNELRAGRYKIGDIRITTTATNPTNYEDNINGDSHYYYWLPYSEGRFLLGAGGDYTSAEAEGGEATHTLSIDEMPIHRHSLGSNWSDTASGTASAFKTTAKRTAKSKETADAGGGHPHNNMPPYKVVYFWKCVSETDYNNAQNSPSE